ncbi:MAG: hypothetical protein CL833_06115 [Crocinitomicaceae bacterium]|nr:hypothetical protein [Crocinitomicaceae bacterium]|tara:strand:+ start:118 stop:672 length:555 start_codon:yes stop_codon:yes gene_type:complete
MPDRSKTPYLVSTIATGIFNDEFDSDTGFATIASISGWLANNVGLLNTTLYTAFSGSGSATEYPDDTVVQPSGSFRFEEADIYKQVYLTNYYTKKARAVLKGIDSSVDFISLREGDSVITRTNKNEIAKTYRGFAKDAQERLDDLVAKYNIYAAEPIQVAGTDASTNASGDIYAAYDYRGRVGY